MSMRFFVVGPCMEPTFISKGQWGMGASRSLDPGQDFGNFFQNLGVGLLTVFGAKFRKI